MKSAKVRRRSGDSVGCGVIECGWAPAGVGDPMFDGMENMIACTVFAIPAVKELNWQRFYRKRWSMGSANNDPFRGKTE